jgi:ATP-binding cassette, subfamily B, bacterial PglK
MTDSATGGSFAASLRALYRALSRRRQRQLRWLAVAMLLGATAELVTIGALLPFLALIADPARAADLPGYGLFLAVTGGGEGGDLIARATILLIVAVILSAAVRALIVRLTQGFVFAVGHEFGTVIFSRMLRQPYSLYVRRNLGAVVAGIDKVQVLVYSMLLPLINGFTSLVNAVAILILLAAIAPPAAAIAALAAILLYLGVSLMMGKRLRSNSTLTAELASARMKAVQEGLGGLRDILLDHAQEIVEEKFRRLDYAYRKAQADVIFVGAAPRFAIEAAGIVLIGLLALHMSRQMGIEAALPVLGALALGSHRLLPLLQTVYVAWSQMSGHERVLRDLMELMNGPIVHAERVAEPVAFTTDVVLDRVTLDHPGGTVAVRDVSLRITKGERVGIAGRTGSGKSSLLDLLMGLLDPSSGEIRIDGRPLDDRARPNWQAQIAHVPQSIWLDDASIASNIAFAQAEIDMARVRAAARRAQIDDFIEDLPNGYDTLVGASGVRLSGGQRQRIAIARAFYKQATILILDEATGQLDVETERAVVEAAFAAGRDVTILVVAHRDTALAACDRVIRLEEGRLVPA